MTRNTDISRESASSEPGNAPSKRPKRFRRPRRALKWLLIGLSIVLTVFLLTPFLMSQAEHIIAGADFVKANPIGFVFVRLTVYAAVIFYWPALIRWWLRNQKNVSPGFLAALQYRGRPIRLLIVFELLANGLPLIINL